MIWRIAVCAVLGYLLGGLNGAIVISHLVLKDDVRSKGSGNAGLTNFLRNYGVLLAVSVVCCTPSSQRE